MLEFLSRNDYDFRSSISGDRIHVRLSGPPVDSAKFSPLHIDVQPPKSSSNVMDAGCVLRYQKWIGYGFITISAGARMNEFSR